MSVFNSDSIANCFLCTVTACFMGVGMKLECYLPNNQCQFIGVLLQLVSSRI
jgi:hypothetical protein